MICQYTLIDVMLQRYVIMQVERVKHQMPLLK